MIKNGNKYLITTNNWFYGPDGNQYRAVYGSCQVVTAKDELGFEPRHSTNWFVRVGSGEGSVIVAGCQIHYAIHLVDSPRIQVGGYVDEKTQATIPYNSILIIP